MLHFIRERAQGWVAWFIVGLITIPFALWGVNSYITGASDIVVASVNGEPIKQAEFQRSLQQYRERMREMMGDSFDPSLFDNQSTKQNILNGLIEQKLLYSANQTLGQRVSDSDINQAVQQTTAFQVDGQFDSERYKMLLARAGFSPASYETQLRIDLLGKELGSSIQRTATVTKHDIDSLLRLEKQKREMAYGVIAAGPLAAEIVINDDDAMAIYNDNKNRYTTPEQVSVDYIELSVADLAKTIDVEETVLKQFYADSMGQFMSLEQRQASHILIEGDAEQALKILAAAEHRLSQGEDFSTVAKELSQDIASAPTGGDLGLLQRGVMDNEVFDSALFGLTEVGDVSEIVKTEYGHHLIKLTGIQASQGKAFADVKSEIEASYRRQEAEQLFFEQAERLAELSYENPDSLGLAAEELELKIQTSTLFTREGGKGIAADKNIVNVAFSDETLVEDLNSAVIELSESHLVVLHKKEHVLTSQLPFEVVSTEIKSTLKSQRAEDKAIEMGKAVLGKLQSGVDDAEPLFPQGQWHEAAVIERSETALDRDILEQAYAMKKPSDTPVYHGFTTSKGNYVVVKLTAVIDGDIEQATEQDRVGLSSYLAKHHGDSELNAFLESLKAEADIDISPDYLK
jgi:peptidyl-prolyl cis-trans isomerase D